jgi:hypothetical protein
MEAPPNEAPQPPAHPLAHWKVAVALGIFGLSGFGASFMDSRFALGTLICGIAAIGTAWLYSEELRAMPGQKARSWPWIGIAALALEVAVPSYIGGAKVFGVAPSPATPMTVQVAAQATATSVPTVAPLRSEVPPDTLTMASNETLRRKAYEIAKEMEDFIEPYNQQYYEIYRDDKLSSDQKADKEELIENTFSEKFKEKFSANYLLLQTEIVKRIGRDDYQYVFDKTMIDRFNAGGFQAHIKDLARKLK